MTRPHALLVVLLRPGTTAGELSDLAELLRHHRVVESTRLEWRRPGLAKAAPRAGNAARRKGA